jgi:hypothetical protein
MPASTWITMIFVLGFVWGGFAVALKLAMSRESEKTEIDRA